MKKALEFLQEIIVSFIKGWLWLLFVCIDVDNHSYSHREYVKELGTPEFLGLILFFLVLYGWAFDKSVFFLATILYLITGLATSIRIRKKWGSYHYFLR